MSDVLKYRVKLGFINLELLDTVKFILDDYVAFDDSMLRSAIMSSDIGNISIRNVSVRNWLGGVACILLFIDSCNRAYAKAGNGYIVSTSVEGSALVIDFWSSSPCYEFWDCIVQNSELVSSYSIVQMRVEGERVDEKDT